MGALVVVGPTLAFFALDGALFSLLDQAVFTAFRGYDELEDEKKIAARMLAAYETEVIADVGRVMMALGSQRLDIRTLSKKTGIGKDKLDRILAFLVTADYVESDAEIWQARALVLGR